MIPAERQQRILSLIKENNGVLSINDLVRLLNVSHMTIRRDLQILEQNKLVESVTGGVRLPNQLIHDLSVQIKENFAPEEKDRIGEKAASYVQDGQCIYLDEGTTSLALAHHITDRKNLTVVTNDFDIVSFLSNNSSANIIHIGGEVRRDTRSSVGMFAYRTLSYLNMDYAFLSCSSWDLRGITTPDSDKVLVKQAAMDSSMHKVLICDSSKYNKVAVYRVSELTKLTEMITDIGLPDEAKTALVNLGIKLTLVENS